MRKAMLILPAVALSVLATATSAHAEQAPGCSRTVQIGSTGYIKKNDVTIASVKQFIGCDRNWAYTYVWDSLANKPGSFSSSAAMWFDGAMNHASNVNGHNKQHVWSEGTKTLDKCTRAYGEVWGIDPGSTPVYWGRSSERC
ncbi:hypothetical protein ACIA8G_10685 [Lentzea sp. NPDC051213]|uniref:hypothetical protein n=1 Tax=Lentzea sp. NPDC051213 TaxID=3364126 RepID=UPI0037BD76A9